MALAAFAPFVSELIRRQEDVNATVPPDSRPNIPEDQFKQERVYMAGVYIGAVAYGVHATIFFITLTLLLKRKLTAWKDWIWIVYILLVFGTSSVGNAVQAWFEQSIWIDNRDFEGGPSAFMLAGSVAQQVVAGNVSFTINLWFQDGLLLYRFWIIFGKNRLLAIAPLLIFMTSFGLSLCIIIMLTQPGMTMWGPIVYQLFMSYWSISIGFNILLTAAIVGRLMHMRYKIGAAIAGPYGSISAMLIESAALYTVTGLIFLAFFVKNSFLQNLLLPTLSQVQSIAPMLIIMRVAQGQAWSADTNHRLQQSTNFGFSGRSGRTGQSDTYAMSNPSFTKSSGGGISTRVETVTWQDESAHEGKVHHVV